jgi:sRNA-binding protein
VTPPVFRALEARLISECPGLFVEKWQAHKPLKRGIREDLLAARPDLDRALLARFLRLYVQRRQYCLAVLESDAQRHDLAGNPVEPVDDRAREHAAKQLADLDAKGLETIETGKARVASARAEREAQIASAVEAPSRSRRLSLRDLKQAALARRAAI